MLSVSSKTCLYIGLAAVFGTAFLLRFLHLSQHGLDSFDAATFLSYVHQHRDILLHLFRHGTISPEQVTELAERAGYLYSPTSLGPLPWLDKPLHNLLLLISGWLFNWQDVTLLYPAALYSFVVVVLTFFITRILAANQWTGLAAAALVGISNFLVLQARYAYPHEESILCVLAGLLLHLHYRRTHRFIFEIGAGILWGLSVCAHPDTIPFVGMYSLLEIARTARTSWKTALLQAASLSTALIAILLLYDLPFWTAILAWGKQTAIEQFISPLFIQYQVGEMDGALPEGLYIFTQLSVNMVQINAFTWNERLFSFLMGTLGHEGYPMVLTMVALGGLTLAAPILFWRLERKWTDRWTLAFMTTGMIFFLVFYSGSTPEVRHIQLYYILIIIVGTTLATILTQKKWTARFSSFPGRIGTAGLLALLIGNLLYIYPLYSYQNGIKQAMEYAQNHKIAELYSHKRTGVNVYVAGYGVGLHTVDSDASLEQMADLPDGYWIARSHWTRPLDIQILQLADNLPSDQVHEFHHVLGVGHFLAFRRTRLASGLDGKIWKWTKSIIRPGSQPSLQTAIAREQDINRWVIVRHQDLLRTLEMTPHTTPAPK